MVAINGTSTGYLGTEVTPSINAGQWATQQPGFGARYWVESAAAGKVTVVSGTTVRVAGAAADGYGIGGWGVVDTLTGNTDLTLPTPGSDGTVYYTIVARRTWQATNETTIEYVTGTAARAIAAGVNVNSYPRGVVDDQPLALVAITVANSGATVTAAVTDDLRAIGGNGQYEATSEIVLQYMNQPGYVVRIGSDEYTRRMDGTWSKNLAAPRAGTYVSWNPDPGSGNMGGSASQRRLNRVNLGVKPYARQVTIQAFVSLGIPDGTTIRAEVQVGAPGEVYDELTTIAAERVAGDTGRQTASMTVCTTVAAGESRQVAVWLYRWSGNGTVAFYNEIGYSFRVDWIETQPGNDW